MLVPRLQRATAARAVVIFAGPLVVESRQVIQHARTDRSLTRAPVAAVERNAPVQIVHHACEAESGARAFLALIEHQSGFAVARQQPADVIVVRPLLRQGDHVRGVLAIAQVETVGAGVEGAAE
jgi:hypothetical protein